MKTKFILLKKVKFFKLINYFVTKKYFKEHFCKSKLLENKTES